MTSFSSLFYRLASLAACLSTLVLLAGQPVCNAQEDPFGFGNGSQDSGGVFDTNFGAGAGGEFGGAGDGAAFGANAEPDVPTDPLIRELRSLAGGNPLQLGLAIREAIRLGNWKEMELYLGGGRVTGLSEEDQLATARRIGSLLLVRALAGPGRNRPELKPEARQALEQLLSVLRKNLVDSNKLDDAIKQLAGDERNEQLKAVRVLRAGGEETIRRVIDAAIRERSPRQLDRLMELLGSFGEPGYEAIELMAVFGADDMRPGALRAANILDARRALPALLSAVAARGSTETERKLAAELLTESLGGIPSQAEIEQFLAGRLDLANGKYEETGPVEGARAIWRVTEDRKSVEPVVIPGRSAAARKAADIGEMLRRIGSLRPNVFAKALGSDLRNRLLSNPTYGSPKDLETLQQLWGSRVNDQQIISAILDNSLGSRMVGGGTADPDNTTIGDPGLAISAIRMLAAIGDAAAVDGVGAESSPLVKAASHPVPQVRYEAATSIEMLHPQHPYMGSSMVLERWIEMSLLENSPRAIVLVNELAKRQAIVQRLNLLGYQVLEVPSVAELIRAVDAGGDIELIVATSRPPDYSAIEMIDRVRRRPLGGAAPMIIVDGWPAGYEQFNRRWRAANVMIAAAVDQRDGDSKFTIIDLEAQGPTPFIESEDNATEFVARENDGYTIRSKKVAPHAAVAALDRPVRRPMTPRETVMQLQLALMDLAGTVSLPEMTAVDRKIYALAGLTALSRLTEDPETSNLYDWKSKEGELAEASRRSGYSEASLRILSSMGTPFSQDLLARIAINPEIPLNVRQFAASSFAESISTAGTRISRRQILGHYDRYNQSQDAELRQNLGIILDAIEARAGVANP